MPTVSQKQFRYMKGVESGAIKNSSLSPEKAAEFTRDQSPKGLPKYASRSIAYNEKRKKKQ